MLAVCFLSGCKGQSGDPMLFQKLKRPAFVAPSPETQKHLHIPFLEGDSYGICNYAGKILLKPQYEDIEMPAFDLPFVKAKKNGEWSLYDFSGKQVLPVSVKMSHLLNVELDYNGLSGNDYRYITKVRDPREGYLKPLPRDKKEGNPNAQIEIEVEQKAQTAPRYFYFSKSTKPPMLSWFAPDDAGYMMLSAKTGYHNQYFTSSVYHGFIKVMDENRRFTLLDENMEPIFPPVFNCAALSPEKVLILNESGLCALRDVKKGWQTDFKFRAVEPTANPDLCLGEAKIDGKVAKFKIDGQGKTTLLESEDSWLPIDERYSRVGVKSGEYHFDFHLLDEKTGKKVRDLKTHRVEKIFETGFGIYSPKNELLGIETVRGDTIWKPPFPRIEAVGDSMYIFYSGDTTGVAARRGNKLIYKVLHSTIGSMGDGTFRIEKDKKVGLLAADGRLILPVEFDQIYPMPTANRLLAQKNGSWGMFDSRTGEAILPPQFKHLQANGFPFWYGGGIEIRAGEDFFILGPGLEIVHQKTQKPILTKRDFPLKNAPDAAKADFEKAEMPMYFTPYTIFKGANWLHIFKCTGEHVVSLEGFKDCEMAYSRSRISNLELGNAALTGVASLTSASGKKVWVRLEDGVLYQK